MTLTTLNKIQNASCYLYLKIYIHYLFGVKWFKRKIPDASIHE